MHFGNEGQTNSGRFIFIVTGCLSKLFIRLWQKFVVHANSAKALLKTSLPGIAWTFPLRYSLSRLSASFSHSCSTSDSVGSSRLNSNLPTRFARKFMLRRRASASIFCGVIGITVSPYFFGRPEGGRKIMMAWLWPHLGIKVRYGGSGFQAAIGIAQTKRIAPGRRSHGTRSATSLRKQAVTSWSRAWPDSLQKLFCQNHS